GCEGKNQAKAVRKDKMLPGQVLRVALESDEGAKELGDGCSRLAHGLLNEGNYRRPWAPAVVARVVSPRWELRRSVPVFPTELHLARSLNRPLAGRRSCCGPPARPWAGRRPCPRPCRCPIGPAAACRWPGPPPTPWQTSTAVWLRPAVG